MNEIDHKAGFSLTRKMLEENRKAGYEHGYSVGYNKAVDDCIEELKKRRDTRYMKVNCDDVELKMLSEKLKGAKQNEDFKQEKIQ